MKRFLVIIFVACVLGSVIGCAPSQTTEEATVASVEPSVLTIPIVEPTPTPVPTPRPVLFHRIDDNPAEFAVCVSTPMVAEIYSSYSGEELRDTLTVLYLDKDWIKQGEVKAEIKSINAYSDGHAFMGGDVITDIDANHIFVSESIEGEFLKGYFSRINRKNGHNYYSLFKLTGEYIGKNSTEYKVSDIVRFLEVSDNKIYYLSKDGNVYSFEMTTQEMKLVEDYEVIDYDSLPEGIDDYTAEYVLAYNEESKTIDITNISIEDGVFIVGDLYKSVDCSELDGDIVDIKAVYDAFFIMAEQDGVTTLYRYSMYEKIFETLYQTEFDFDCSYATEEDYFAAFYGGDYNIQAIKYNFEEGSNRLIYEGGTCAYWEHVSPNEDTVDEVVEYPRYEDINYMTYKGNMLFGFNIDDDGVTTLVFKSDVIDRELLPLP